jgi:hypothetical protein
MIDTDRLRPRIGPLDVWRIGASFLFLGFGGYFIVTFLLSLTGSKHRPWSQLLLGGLILLYGLYRLISGFRNYRLMIAEGKSNQSAIGDQPRDETAHGPQ